MESVRIATLERELDELRATVRDLQALVEQRTEGGHHARPVDRAGVAPAPTVIEPSESSDDVPEVPLPAATTSRRGMLRAAGAAAVGATAMAATGGRAAAESGLTIGPSFSQTSDNVRVSYTGSSTIVNAFQFSDNTYGPDLFSIHPAILAGWASATNQPNGVYGFSTANAGAGVVGRGSTDVGTATGVLAIAGAGLPLLVQGQLSGSRVEVTSADATGVEVVAAESGATGYKMVSAQPSTVAFASTLSGTGSAAVNVFVEGANSFGIVSIASAASSIAVAADNAAGVGVRGTGTTGVRGEATNTAVRAVGDQFGVRSASANGYSIATDRAGIASLWLRTDNDGTPRTAPPGRSDVHQAGEIETDGNGDLWYCYAGGTPGSWRRLAGATTAGSFHAVTPFRVYDSRAAAPAPGPLAAGSSRDVSVADARDTTSGAVVTANAVPAGATAIACNLTVVNTAGGGFLTVNPGGVTTVTAASVNWTAAGQVLNNGIIAAIDPATRLVTVVCGGGGATDVVLDVTGYYR
jgi:hypothetical protein